MDDAIRGHLDQFTSPDKAAQNEAYVALLKATETRVDWAYEAWDRLTVGLTHKDNHVRAIAAQVLAQLAAYSDPEMRISGDFEALLNGTQDERFVTARHTLQSIWKVGLGGAQQRQMTVEALARRFEKCADEKNCTLIRFDIAQGLRNLYDATQDESIQQRALSLIEMEQDAKYRRKYAAVWKK